MANLTGKTIPQLPAADAMSDNDLLVVSQSGSLKKKAWSSMKNAISNAFYPLSIANGGTGAATAAAARANLGLANAQFTSFLMTANTNKSITFAAATHNGVIVTSGTYAKKRALIIYGTTSSGEAGASVVATGDSSSLISVSASGNSLTLTNSGTGNAYVCIFQWSGSSLPTVTDDLAV